MPVRFMTAQDVNGYEDSSMFILNTKDVGETLSPGFNESQSLNDSSVSEIVDGFGSSSAFILNTLAAARLAGGGIIFRIHWFSSILGTPMISTPSVLQTLLCLS